MSFTLDTIRQQATAHCTVGTPLGAMLLVRTGRGLAGAWFEGQKYHLGALDAPCLPDDPLLTGVARQLRAYFAGDEVDFDVPLDLHGTPFQRNVWQALLAIGAGRTSTYGDVARDLGASAAVRALGAAVGKNPVSLIVPCHRVVGSTGALTGYAGGLDRKRSLLAIERRELFI